MFTLIDCHSYSKNTRWVYFFGSKMEVLKELTEQGKVLGYEGEALQEFVSKQQDKLREERLFERDCEREQREIELRRLELEQKYKYESQLDTNIKSKGPKIPPFDEGRDDMDAYLRRFERYAIANSWKREHWGLHLSALLKGKALEVFSRMPVGDSLVYDKLKTALLQRFNLTADGFKQRFRNATAEKGESFQQFAVRQAEILERWVELSKCEHSYEGLFDLILREQFVNIVKRDLVLFLKERLPKTVGEMAILADQYREARMIPVTALTRAPGSQVGSSVGVDRPIRSQGTYDNGDRGSKPVQGQGQLRSGVGSMEKRRCFRCGKVGHIASDRKCGGSVASVGRGASGSGRGSYGKSGNGVGNTCAAFVSVKDSIKDSVAKIECGVKLSMSCEAGRGRGSLPTSTGLLGGCLVTVLRDTGCSGVVVRRKWVKDSELIGKVQTCVLADGSKVDVPVAKVKVSTPYYSGEVEAWCMVNPIYDLIIGNIIGARSPDDPDGDWSLPVQAVETRVQVKQRETTRNSRSKMRVPNAVGGDIGPEEMKTDQGKDETLDKLRRRVGEAVDGGKVTFVYKKGLLYRVFKSEREVCEQLVVPKCFRGQVLKLAHESVMSGHLGVQRTATKLLHDFYWPGVMSDVKRFCRSCDICQRTIPKGKVGKAPLGKMPLIEVPFQRVAVDLVGPIEPRTTSGKRYILTLVDYATRYPEAVAIGSIDTETVAEALLGMFCRIGVPMEILSDLGTQFTSELMQEVSRLLSIKRLTTSPYHPMCNGLVESFNGQLKLMLKRLCAERPRDWDKYLNPVLFAYRDAPQESLGFSPFELVYGRSVRGPMKILKELWTKEVPDVEVKSTYQYVIDLQERLERTCEMARENLTKASQRYRKYYNRSARDKDIAVGSKVLVLLPTKNNKLLLQWRGPYEIIKKVGTLDYRVRVGDKDKTFHANMLKPYFEREVVEQKLGSVGAVLGTVSVSVVDVEPEDSLVGEDSELPGMSDGVSSALDCHISDTLTEEQRSQVTALVSEFSDVLSNKPGLTNLVKHDIKLTSSEPIRSRQYAMPFAMRGTIVSEVQKMKDLGVIEPADSPYCSNIVIVKKSDGTNRFCIDFRAINRYTVFDAEPIPDMEDIFVRLSNCKYITKIDLTKGYWQMPLVESAKKYTAFQTPLGLFQFRVLPFGMVCASASFSRMMRKLLEGLDCVENFIDDIIVYNMEFDQHLVVLKELFTRLRNANLTAKPSKCFIAFESVDCLGHVVGNNKLALDKSKVEAIRDAPNPTTKKQVRSFLGLVGFYRKFVPNFSSIAVPLTDLTKKGQPNKVHWSDCHERAFKTLKGALCSFPILKLPDIGQKFFLQTDASDTGIGAVLLQEEDGVKKPVAFVSRKLKKSECAYSVIERECLAIVWAIMRFSRYLYGKEFVLETDHQPLVYLNRSKVANARLMRWALVLQPYRFCIRAIAGKDNVGADYLSRL